jgi:hypothetical protein
MFAGGRMRGPETPHFAMGAADTGPQHASTAALRDRGGATYADSGTYFSSRAGSGFFARDARAYAGFSSRADAGYSSRADAGARYAPASGRDDERDAPGPFGVDTSRRPVLCERVTWQDGEIQSRGYFCWTQIAVLLTFFGMMIGSFISLLEIVVFYWWIATLIMLPLFGLLVLVQTALYIVYLKSQTCTVYSEGPIGVRTPHYTFGRPHLRELQTAVIATGVLVAFAAGALVFWVVDENLPVTFGPQDIPAGAENKYFNMVIILFVLGSVGSYLLMRSVLAQFFPLKSLGYSWAILQKP